MNDQQQVRASFAHNALIQTAGKPALVAMGVAITLLVTLLYLPPSFLNNIGWQLYLDRLTPSFALPLNEHGRLMLSAAIGLLAFLISLFIGLILPMMAWKKSSSEFDDSIDASGDISISDRLGDERSELSEADQFPSQTGLPMRNESEAHPDDAYRPIIRAERDLPAGGLVSKPRSDEINPANDPLNDGLNITPDGSAAPMKGASSPPIMPIPPIAPHTSFIDASAPLKPLSVADLDLNETLQRARAAANLQPAKPGTGPDEPSASFNEAELILADLAADSAIAEGAEPWLQSVEQASPIRPKSTDMSLSALVARLEAGFHRRSAPPPPQAEVVPVPVPESPPVKAADHQVDIALEAALSTLHRMNLRAVG